MNAARDPYSGLTVDAVRDLAADVTQRFETWRRARVGFKGTLLYVLATPLALTGVIELAKGAWPTALAAAGAFTALVAAGRIYRHGLREAIFAPARRYTPAPRVPRRWQAAALVCAGTALAAWGVVGHGIVASALFAGLALGGFRMAYGLAADPARTPPPATQAMDARLREALARAERRILAIESVADTVGNSELTQRLRRIAAQGRGVLDLIAERPGELFRARKFLSVFLEGAERVARRFQRTHPIARSRELEDNFRRVLEEIEAEFERQRAQLTAHEVEDLDVQIEVLRKRLRTEGMI